MKILTKHQQRFINGFGPASSGSGQEPETGCTGDLDGDMNTTYDKYCKEGETQN